MNNDDFDKSFDKSFNRMAKAGIAGFVFVALLAVSLLGVSVWALVALVGWITSK